MSLFSSFVAASVAWEKTRRLGRFYNKDWRLDENIFVVALKQSDNTYPELDELFSSITGLINSASRYNTRISATRNFYRWLNFFSGCMQVPAGEVFHFAGGQGNYDMVSELSSSSCGEELEVDEKGDVTPTSDYLFLPNVYSFDVPMTFDTFKTIKTNRTKAVGVSQSTTGHVPYHILDFKWWPVKGYAKVVGIEGKH